MTQSRNQLPVTRATPGAMCDRQLPATAMGEIHTFTLVFPGGAIAVLHVHGAPKRDEARVHASSVLPNVSYAVVDGDETHGHVAPFHTWTKRHLSLLRNEETRGHHA